MRPPWNYKNHELIVSGGYRNNNSWLWRFTVGHDALTDDSQRLLGCCFFDPQLVASLREKLFAAASITVPPVTEDVLEPEATPECNNCAWGPWEGSTRCNKPLERCCSTTPGWQDTPTDGNTCPVKPFWTTWFISPAALIGPYQSLPFRCFYSEKDMWFSLACSRVPLRCAASSRELATDTADAILWTLPAIFLFSANFLWC